MTFWERFYWFRFNLIRFIVGIPFHPLWWLKGTLSQIRPLFITDGSEELSWPWEWDWRIDD